MGAPTPSLSVPGVAGRHPLPAFAVAAPSARPTAAPPRTRPRVGVPADRLRRRPARAVGRRAAAPAALAMSDGGGGGGGGGGDGGGGGGSVKGASAAAPRVLPPHLTAPAPPTAVAVTQGALHDWRHPTLRRDGRFYGFVGEWGSFGPPGEPRRELSAAAGTRTRLTLRRGARVWAHPPAGRATELLHINLSSTEPAVGVAATLRDVDGLYEKRWVESTPAEPAAAVLPSAPGAVESLFSATGGAVWGLLGGPTDAGGVSYYEVFLRGDAAAGWSVVLAWNEGAPHPALVSYIREAPVGGLEGVDGEAVELPAVPPATPPLPVASWVGGYPGPTEADAGAGTATVMAVVGGDGGDAGRVMSWTVEGVRWTPVGGSRAGDAAADRLVALEDGLYLSVMADARAGGVIEFGSASPPRPGQARQRMLVVVEPGAVVSRVVHEMYPPPGGGAAA